MTWRVVSKPKCKWCARAKSLLAVYGQEFVEDFRDSPEKQKAFKDEGYTSFPQVFRDGKLIGGYDALRDYIERGGI